MAKSELAHWLKKIAGKYEKHKGIRTYESYPVVSLKPEQTFDDSGTAVKVNAYVEKLKVPSDSDAEAKINFDSPVDSEYTTIYPGTGHTYNVIAGTIYVEAPAGHTCKLNIETGGIEE